MAKAESLRNNFLEGKEYLFKKSDFSNLPVSDKAALWNEKLNQLIAQDFPVEHLYLLKQIKVEYEKAVLKQDNKMKELILDLAIITPENDFSIMLLDLGDYSYVGFKQEKVNPAFYNYLESCDYTYSDAKLPPTRACNCNYTCTVQTVNPVVCHTSSCMPTFDGCGPFGFSACDGLLYLC